MVFGDWVSCVVILYHMAVQNSGGILMPISDKLHNLEGLCSFSQNRAHMWRWLSKVAFGVWLSCVVAPSFTAWLCRIYVAFQCPSLTNFAAWRMCVHWCSTENAHGDGCFSTSSCCSCLPVYLQQTTIQMVHKNKPMSLMINHSLYLTVTPFTHLPPTLGNGTKCA